MKYVRRKLKDLKTGDLVLDIDGHPTKVVSKTPIRLSNDVYSIVLKNQNGNLKTIKADGKHLWPMAAPLNGSLPEPYRNLDEMTTSELYETYQMGFHAMLSPAYSHTGMSIWQVYSVCMATDREVQCITVESPTHTFLIASDHDREEFIGDGNVEDASTDDLTYVIDHSIPTHNCGGPLALDTRLTLYKGGYTTMADVKVGDVLVSENGRPTTVTETSPVMMAESMYEIEFEDIDDKHDYK